MRKNYYLCQELRDNQKFQIKRDGVTIEETIPFINTENGVLTEEPTKRHKSKGSDCGGTSGTLFLKSVDRFDV